MDELIQTMGGGIGAVFIISILVTCIFACGFVVITSVTDTIRTIRSMLRNRKTKK